MAEVRQQNNNNMLLGTAHRQPATAEAAAARPSQ